MIIDGTSLFNVDVNCELPQNDVLHLSLSSDIIHSFISDGCTGTTMTWKLLR